MALTITKIDDFLDWWQAESDSTRKVFGKLTDASLEQTYADDFRTLGRMAWHIITTFPEMLHRMGLKLDVPTENDPIPKSAEEIQTAYDNAASAMAEIVKTEWTDETLQVEDDMYGQTWKRGTSLFVFVEHEIHHRAQMTILMRLAGLEVPGVYGPAKHEWKNIGMEPPVV